MRKFVHKNENESRLDAYHAVFNADFSRSISFGILQLYISSGILK